MTDSEQASELCMSCGLCCNGSLFSWVKLRDDETDLPSQLGLEPVDGQQGFAQPCARLEGTCCTIYEHRPSSCRGFRCRLLVAAEQGDTTFERAGEIVAQARSLLEQAALPREQFHETQTAILGGEPEAGVSPLVQTRRRLALLSMHRLFDRHFRKEGREQNLLRPMEQDPAGTS